MDPAESLVRAAQSRTTDDDGSARTDAESIDWRRAAMDARLECMRIVENEHEFGSGCPLSKKLIHSAR